MDAKPTSISLFSNPALSRIRAMIARHIDFTSNFLKASRIRDYAQPKKIACGIKRQARARAMREFSGLISHGIHRQFFSPPCPAAHGAAWFRAFQIIDLSGST